MAATALLATLASSCTGLSVNRPAAPKRAQPGAEAGGTLVVGIQRPASLDPANIADPSGALVASLLCEPLVQIDPSTGRIVDGLVENVVVGRRGAAFTMRLRRDVRFHNGETLTAQDVAYSLSRVARHDVAAADAEILAPIAGYDEIHAPLPPTETGEPSERRLTGVRAITANAVEVTLQRPNAEFLRALSLPLAAPVPEELPDRLDGFDERPVCIGPYRLARPYGGAEDSIELVRFEDYYGGNAAFTRGGRGYPNRIVFRILATPEEEAAAFASGQVDLAHVPPGTSLSEEYREHVQTAAAPSVELLGVPLNQPPYDDPRVRSLLSRAIDRQRLVQRVFGGGRLPANRFLPPTIASVAPSEACARNVPPQGVADPGADLGDLRATPLVLKVNPDFRNRALADEVALQWREKLGLEVRVVEVEWPEYLRQVTSPQGIDALFRESWVAPYPSADAVLHPLFHSSRIGTDNWSRFNDQDFDRRLERLARRGESEEERRARYLSLEAMLCRDLPMIPLTFGQNEFLIRTPKVASAVDGFFDATAGQPLLREFFVRSR